MKTKLYRKWIRCIVNVSYEKTLFDKIIDELFTSFPILELENWFVVNCHTAYRLWKTDQDGLASAFRKKYAKYSRRYYDDDNTLKRIIETGHED